MICEKKNRLNLTGVRTEQFSLFDHSLGVVRSLGQCFVQQGFGFLLSHRVLQTHCGKDGQSLGIGPQSLIDVIGHSHSLSNPIGCQVTVNQTCEGTVTDYRSLEQNKNVLHLMEKIETMEGQNKKVKRAFIAVETAGCQAHGLSEMDDGFLNTTHVSQCCPLQEESLHTVAVQLDGLGSQVEGSGVSLAIKAVTPEQQTQIQRITKTGQ